MDSRLRQPTADRHRPDRQYGAITRKAGTENASPSAPAVDTDNLLLCDGVLPRGDDQREDADDASNGYITDARGVCVMATV